MRVGEAIWTPPRLRKADRRFSHIRLSCPWPRRSWLRHSGQGVEMRGAQRGACASRLAVWARRTPLFGDAAFARGIPILAGLGALKYCRPMTQPAVTPRVRRSAPSVSGHRGNVWIGNQPRPTWLALAVAIQWQPLLRMRAAAWDKRRACLQFHSLTSLYSDSALGLGTRGEIPFQTMRETGATPVPLHRHGLAATLQPERGCLRRSRVGKPMAQGLAAAPAVAHSRSLVGGLGHVGGRIWPVPVPLHRHGLAATLQPERGCLSRSRVGKPMAQGLAVAPAVARSRSLVGGLGHVGGRIWPVPGSPRLRLRQPRSATAWPTAPAHFTP